MDLVPRLTCVEYPAAVRDPDRAIVSLGGKDAIRKTINASGAVPLELSLRDDRFSHPITSRSNTDSHSVLIMVKVKKDVLAENNGDLRNTLHAHPEQYTATLCGVLNCHVRFREMADFQYSTLNSPFVSKIRSSLYSGDLSAISAVKFADDLQYNDMPPPPRFSRVTIPFDYAYRQNPAVHPVHDASGVVKLVNKSVAQRLFSKVVRWTDASVPDETYPSVHLRPPQPTPGNPRLLEIIELLKTKFEERPIWTRRALEEEALDDELRRMWASQVKFALPYVAFTWKSGPWRATYTRYGVDPRSDPMYARFQTEYFRITPSEEHLKMNSGDGVPAHVFDGIHLPAGRSFQLCDITDPVLAELVTSGSLRDTVDEHDGWYRNTTISKIRRIVRMKLRALWNGQQIKQMDVAKILEEPSDDETGPGQNLKSDDIANEPIKDATNEKEVLHAVSAVSADGGDKLRELLGILQQEVPDADNDYEIYDDDEEDSEAVD